jgi:hypothetical protein
MYDPACKKYPPVYYLNVEEIPLPPPQKQNRTGTIVVLRLVVLVLIMSVSVTGVYIKNDQSRAKSSPQTFPTTHTFTTLVRDFQKADLKVWTVQYGKSINEWNDGNYSIPLAFMNSAICGDITACTGPCTPEQIGLWVYGTSADAFSAYQEIINTTPLNGGGYLGVLAAYVQCDACCLALVLQLSLSR